MADERVETCLTCESAVGFGSSQSLGSPGSHKPSTGRFGSCGTRLVGIFPQDAFNLKECCSSEGTAACAGGEGVNLREPF